MKDDHALIMVLCLWLTHVATSVFRGIEDPKSIVLSLLLHLIAFVAFIALDQALLMREAKQ